jgi:hypothetical protein
MNRIYRIPKLRSQASTPVAHCRPAFILSILLILSCRFEAAARKLSGNGPARPGRRTDATKRQCKSASFDGRGKRLVIGSAAQQSISYF